MTQIAPQGSMLALAILVAAALLLDFGTTANMTLGQRAIFSLGAELRGRLNGLYVAAFFIGCAVGSALGGWAYAEGGWALAAWVGLAFPVVALAFFMTEWSEGCRACVRGQSKAVKPLPRKRFDRRADVRYRQCAPAGS